jgi:hypothetical protein
LPTDARRAATRLERGVGPTQIVRQARMHQITVFAGLDGLALGEASTKTEEIARRVVPPSVDTEIPEPAS